jgi:hypothetical protein
MCLRPVADSLRLTRAGQSRIGMACHQANMRELVHTIRPASSLPDPVGQVTAGSQGVRLLGALDPLADDHRAAGRTGTWAIMQSVSEPF